MQIVADRIRDCSFLVEERFRGLKSLILDDCTNIEGALVADVVVNLPELRKLSLRNASVSQYNVLALSRNAKQLSYLDATCDKFLYTVGYVVVSNLKALTVFQCDILNPGIENKDWLHLMAMFAYRVKFGGMMVRHIKFWERMIVNEGFVPKAYREQ